MFKIKLIFIILLLTFISTISYSNELKNIQISNIFSQQEVNLNNQFKVNILTKNHSKYFNKKLFGSPYNNSNTISFWMNDKIKIIPMNNIRWIELIPIKKE
jgi:hypothetical protein